MDDIERKMAEIKWSYAESDPNALAELKRRIEDTGRREDLITYSDLVKGVKFHLPNVNKGQPFQIDIHECSILDRANPGRIPRLHFDPELSPGKSSWQAV